MNVGDHLHRYIRKIKKLKILGFRLEESSDNKLDIVTDIEVQDAEYQLKEEFDKQKERKRKDGD